MKKEILTHYIFLDTSIFVKENFFAGNKLKAFLKNAQDSNIELITTEITIKECISKLIQELEKSKITLKKALKSLDYEAKAFKNIKSLDEIFKLNRVFEFDKEKQALIKRFEKLIKKNFTVIEIDPQITNKVIDDYFNNKPPFKVGEKKHEFPDALVLNSLESWCEKNKKKAYIISVDDDMITYNSDYLIPIKEYDELLNEISYTFGEDNIGNKVDETIERNTPEILSIIKSEFVENFPSYGFDNVQGFDYDINDINVSDCYISIYYILETDGNEAKVELELQVEYITYVRYQDTNSGWYDKEDRIWYGVNIVETEISNSCQIYAIIDIEFELPGKPQIWKDFEFIEISEGIPENISIEP